MLSKFKSKHQCDDNADADVCDGESSRAQKRRLCGYNKEWEKTYTWLTADTTSESAKCVICSTTFQVKWDGLKAVKSHNSSEKHKVRVQSATQSKLLTNFFVQKNTSEENKVIAAEVASVFHYTQHHHSYLSMDCSLKLARKCFPDSKIAAKISCGKTKCEAIVCNVLAPHSVELIQKNLNDSFFSISSDASNKKNQKLFPLCIQYYSTDVGGICSRVLDFYEDSNETSDAIADRIRSILKENNLDIQRVTAYTADNAAVNYGKHRSVFQNIKKDNPNLIAASCNCHIIHNVAKQAGKTLGPMDVETLIIKIYNEFSISAKNVAQLKEFYEFVELEWENILRHVPTRWLSIYPALTRLLEKWPAIKAYFLSLGGDECDPVIWKFVSNNSDSDNTESDPPSLEEAYLYFYHHILGIFHNRILLLEQSKCCSPQVYDIMCGLLKELQERLQDEFYGYKVNTCLRELLPKEKIQLKSTLNKYYQRAAQYLKQWFDFSDENPFHTLKTFNLTSEIQWSHLETAVCRLNLTQHIDTDALYSEYVMIKDIASAIIQKEKDVPCEEKWNLLFQKCEVGSLPNLFKLVQFVLSIPVSNAFTERVFSIMGNIWSDTRNCLQVDVVKAEIQCKVNFSQNCSEFYEYLLSNPLLLQAAKNNKKYAFKFNNGQ